MAYQRNEVKRDLRCEFLHIECAKPCYSYRARRARYIGVYGGRATGRYLRLFPTL